MCIHQTILYHRTRPSNGVLIGWACFQLQDCLQACFVNVFRIFGAPCLCRRYHKLHHSLDESALFI